jgi:mannose-6-phosphate isomerase-like protein (cupin superfamily)
VLEGKGIVEIGDEKKEVTKDTYIDSPAKIPHCWYNESTEILRVLVVKTPNPLEKGRIL